MKPSAYVLLLCVSVLSGCAVGDFMGWTTPNIEGDVDTTLRAFARQHSLDYPELKNKLNHVGLVVRKGGVGLIAHEAYVILDEPRNTLLLAGHEWAGEVSSKPEVVMTDGVRILDSLAGADRTKVIVVLFSPSDVRFIRLSGPDGGRYLRYLKIVRIK